MKFSYLNTNIRVFIKKDCYLNLNIKACDAHDVRETTNEYQLK